MQEFNRIRNKELTIGGIVAAAGHRVSKAGKPFGSFVIEDYGDSFEVMVFGEDYVKFKGYLQEGFFVQIRGLVQERFRQPGNWGFELKSIQLLSDLREKMAKSFTIQLPLHLLDDGLVHRIRDLATAAHAEDQAANCRLKFKILDAQDELALDLSAKSMRINLTNAFLDGLGEMEALSYRLN